MTEHAVVACELTPEACSVYADILSQAVTGELVGMQNFAALVGLYEDVDEKIEALEHAEIEKRHAMTFRSLASDLGVTAIADLKAPYWKRISEAFLRWAGAKDLTACMLIQEVMLESFAVSMYGRIGATAPGRLGRTFAAIAVEETEHLEHALKLFEREFVHDPMWFEAKVSAVHEDVMTVLAEMVAREDPGGHCGLCKNACVKSSLGLVDLDIVRMRGEALSLYLRSLDRIGLPGEKTLQWVTQLPV
jgi:fatty aldehyde decarbonylase